MPARVPPETSRRELRRSLAALFALGVVTGCISFAGLTGGGDAGEDSNEPKEAGGDGRRDASTDAGREASVDCGAFSVPPATSLADSFDGSTLSGNWFTPLNENCAVQIAGELIAGAKASYCLFFTKKNYHLTCSSVTVEVPETALATVTGVQTVMYLDTTVEDAGQTSLILEGGGFQFVDPDKASTPLGPYSPSTDRWWRLSEANGELSFSTSPDGTTFTQKGMSIADPMPLDDVTIALGAGDYKGIPDAGEAKFRCYNLSPSICQ
jgi:hypothetical protein